MTLYMIGIGLNDEKDITKPTGGIYFYHVI